MTAPGSDWVAAMRAGRHEEAWALSSADLAARDPATRDDPREPYHLRWVWDGRPFDGRRVLVRCYHGLGDTIQFARFLPRLAARAGAVTVEAQASLVPLLPALAACIVPFDPAHPLPPAECDIEITELAFALRARPEDAAPPYLSAAAAQSPPGLIAICYGSGDWDPARAIPADLFAPICRRVRCLSLVAEPCLLPVQNPAGCPLDMGETAALIAGAALVITVDTMVAHLAGALGRPTWLLLKADPDWRWVPRAATSPWYPTMRLFTQPSPGDWGSVLVAVEAALEVEQLI